VAFFDVFRRIETASCLQSKSQVDIQASGASNCVAPDEKGRRCNDVPYNQNGLDMTEEIESLVLEILKKIQNDITGIKDEMKADRLWRASVDSHMTAIDSHLTAIHLEIAQVNARIDGMSRRIERLEDRLGLAEA